MLTVYPPPYTLATTCYLDYFFYVPLVLHHPCNLASLLCTAIDVLSCRAPRSPMHTYAHIQSQRHPDSLDLDPLIHSSSLAKQRMPHPMINNNVQRSRCIANQQLCHVMQMRSDM
jgi:hypothetical protein